VAATENGHSLLSDNMCSIELTVYPILTIALGLVFHSDKNY